MQGPSLIWPSSRCLPAPVAAVCRAGRAARRLPDVATCSCATGQTARGSPRTSPARGARLDAPRLQQRTKTSRRRQIPVVIRVAPADHTRRRRRSGHTLGLGREPCRAAPLWRHVHVMRSTTWSRRDQPGCSVCPPTGGAAEAAHQAARAAARSC